MATFRQGSWLYNFGIGMSPFKPSVQLTNHAAGHGYSEPQGLLILRKAFAAFVQHHRLVDDILADPADVLVGAGAKPLIWATIQVLGKRIVLVEGSWVSYTAHAAMAAKEVVWIKADYTKGKVDWPRLEEVLQEDDLFVLSSPSNPWGTLYEEDEMARLGILIRSKKAWMLADEIYWPLVRGSMSKPSMASYCPERAVLIDSLSKWTSLAGWRLGLAWFGIENLIQQVLPLTTHLYSCAPVPAQEIALDLYTSFPFDLLTQHNQILDFVREWIWEQLTRCSYFRGKFLVKPSSAFYFFLPIEKGLVKTLDARGLCLVEGVHFGLEGYARLAMTPFDGTAMVEAVQKGHPLDEELLVLHGPALVKGIHLLVHEAEKFGSNKK